MAVPGIEQAALTELAPLAFTPLLLLPISANLERKASQILPLILNRWSHFSISLPGADAMARCYLEQLAKVPHLRRKNERRYCAPFA